MFEVHISGKYYVSLDHKNTYKHFETAIETENLHNLEYRLKKETLPLALAELDGFSGVREFTVEKVIPLNPALTVPFKYQTLEQLKHAADIDYDIFPTLDTKRTAAELYVTDNASYKIMEAKYLAKYDPQVTEAKTTPVKTKVKTLETSESKEAPVVSAGKKGKQKPQTEENPEEGL